MQERTLELSSFILLGFEEKKNNFGGEILGFGAAVILLVKLLRLHKR